MVMKNLVKIKRKMKRMKLKVKSNKIRRQIINKSRIQIKFETDNIYENCDRFL